jgi:hypothetical protein
MADVYNLASGATTVGANARKVAPTTRISTPPLVFVNVAAVHNAAAVDFRKEDIAGLAATTTFTNANSVFSRAVIALQGFAEIYVVGTPSATSFTVVVNSATANAGDSNTTPTGWGAAEAAIRAAIGADTSVTLTELSLSGNTLA